MNVHGKTSINLVKRVMKQAVIDKVLKYDKYLTSTDYLPPQIGYMIASKLIKIIKTGNTDSNLKYCSKLKIDTIYQNIYERRN